MFSPKEETPMNTTSSAPHTIIGHGIKVKGTFSGTGNMVVHGEVEGTLSTSGDLAIEEGAVVSANIEAQNVRVSGNITGSITCHGQLELNSSAQIHGDVTTDIISVDNGAIMQGQCQTGVKNATSSQVIDTVPEEEASESEA